MSLHYARYKTVTQFRHGLDIPMSVRVVAQGFPQGGDILAEVVFLYDRLRPDRLEQIIFSEDVTAV